MCSERDGVIRQRAIVIGVGSFAEFVRIMRDLCGGVIVINGDEPRALQLLEKIDAPIELAVLYGMSSSEARSLGTELRKRHAITRIVAMVTGPIRITDFTGTGCDRMIGLDQAELRELVQSLL